MVVKLGRNSCKVIDLLLSLKKENWGWNHDIKLSKHLIRLRRSHLNINTELISDSTSYLYSIFVTCIVCILFQQITMSDKPSNDDVGDDQHNDGNDIRLNGT